MHYPKLFSPKSLLTWLLAALFVVTLGALPIQAQPFADMANVNDNTVSVIDVAGNTVSPVESKLTLKFNLQACSKPGPVTVELRSGTSPYDLVESVNGTGGGNVAAVISFGKAADGAPYYVVVKSANSIETWSATTIKFNSNAASYDFTTNINKAFGNNQILSSDGIACIYQGDVNQDGRVDLTDLLAVYNDSSNFATGKPATDFNCDGITDLADITVTYNNSQKFVVVVKP